MKTYLILIIITTFGAILNIRAQIISIAHPVKTKSKIDLAGEYLSKYPKAPEKALTIYLECANEGNAEAMNAIGKLYASGNGIEQNNEKALEWFHKATEAGHVPAYYNIGMIYKYANGVNQNFNLAYQYIKKSAELGYSNGKYYQGYMLYKGLGCKQDYLTAMEMFEAATEAKEPKALYFLGLCYRNGYGVETDTLLGNYYLRKAANYGLSEANVELSQPESEFRPILTTQIAFENSRIPNLKRIPQSYKRIKQTVDQTTIEGKYTGWFIMYDWSGNSIVQRVPLQFDLNIRDRLITGIWEENGSKVNFNAFLTDTTIEFIDFSYRRKEHYHQNNPLLWELKRTSVQIIKSGPDIFFAGNVSFYLPELKEPSKPVYISLYREIANIRNTVEVEQTIKEKENTISEVIVYPNPFSGDLKLQFKIASKCRVKINVTNLNGKSIYNGFLDCQSAGVYNQQLPLNIPCGTYIVKVSDKASSVSSIAIKQ